MATPHLSPDRFIAYEISPVAEYESGTCEPFPTMDEAREASDSTFWSLYGVANNREVMCIGDYCDYDRAADIYRHITGCVAPSNPDGLQQLNLPNGR